MKIFSQFTISAKIMLLVSFLLMLSAILGGYGWWKSSLIADEIAEIAHVDIPLTEHISMITTLQLEQIIQLERALRFGKLAGSDKLKLNKQKLY